MSALGHKQPVGIISAERLLPEVKRTFRNNYFEIKLPIALGKLGVSAFLNSGRSVDGIWSILKGSFRPEADMQSNSRFYIRI
jgi:hypothetical protein